MSAMDDLLVELATESDLTGGELTFAFWDDFMLRVAALYDELEEDDPDRFWCELLAMYVTGAISRDQLAALLARFGEGS